MICDQIPNHWYAVRVKSNRERVTAEALRGKDFEVFLPAYHASSLRNGKLRPLSIPLFAGYVFCRFDVRYRLPILTIPGVVNVVGIGNIPQAVETHEMDRIFALAQSQLPIAPFPFPPVGERIQLQSGPLKGMEGIILSHQGQNKLVVSVTLLQRSVAVNVEREWLGTRHQSFFAA